MWVSSDKLLHRQVALNLECIGADYSFMKNASHSKLSKNTKLHTYIQIYE